MLNSTALEVGIGLIFVFLIFSLILTAVVEMIEVTFKNRAIDLQRALAELLGDETGTGLRKELMEHGMVSGLFRGQPDAKKLGKLNCCRWFGHGLPSYIPKESFAKALIDLRASAADSETNTLPLAENVTTAFSAMHRYADGDPAALQAEVERWYDATMERATGWFKRRTQWILFWVGLAAAFGLNINAIAIVHHLESRPEARAAIITASSEAVKAGVRTVAVNPETIKTELAKLESASLPIGWADGGPLAATARDKAEKAAGGPGALFFGWLIMAVAATLGAPFWFDLLSKIMQVRAALKPDEIAAGAAERAAPPQTMVVDNRDPRTGLRRDASTAGV